jgi:hypothetical protein
MYNANCYNKVEGVSKAYLDYAIVGMLQATDTPSNLL